MDQIANSEILDSNPNQEQDPSLRLKSRVKKLFKNFKKSQIRTRKRKIESYSQTPDETPEAQVVKDVERDPSYIPQFQQETDGTIRLISSSVEPISEINFPAEVGIDSLKSGSVRLGGSSEVVLTTLDGQTVVIKEARLKRDGSRNTEQMYEEFIADRIYSELGFSTPISKLYENGRYRFVTYVTGKDLNAIRAENEFSYARQELRRGFVLDCFLGNWDVLGSGWDNVRLGSDGRVYRIDNGGALRYRARGEVKGTKFSRDIGELKTISESESRIFQNISNLEIYEQGMHIINNFDKIVQLITSIGENVPEIKHQELISILRERLEDLKIKMEQIRSSDPSVQEKYPS